MKKIRLNGAKMEDVAAAHAYLKRKLELPDYYGENLDALWDCLSTDQEAKRITIINRDNILRNLGEYGVRLLDLFEEVAKENHHIEVDIAE